MAIYGIDYINENMLYNLNIDEYINEFYIDESLSLNKAKDSLVNFVVTGFRKLIELIKKIKQKIITFFAKKRQEKIAEKLKNPNQLVDVHFIEYDHSIFNKFMMDIISEISSDGIAKSVTVTDDFIEQKTEEFNKLNKIDYDVLKTGKRQFFNNAVDSNSWFIVGEYSGKFDSLQYQAQKIGNDAISSVDKINSIQKKCTDMINMKYELPDENANMLKLLKMNILFIQKVIDKIDDIVYDNYGLLSFIITKYNISNTSED